MISLSYVRGVLILSSLYAYNKVDSIGIEHMDKLAREPNTVVMSCELDLGVQDVVERCWDELKLIRIYTKRLYTYGEYFVHIMLTTVQKRYRARFQRSTHCAE